jgi:hypothetical protein
MKALRRSASRVARNRSEGGFTFIELVITIVLLSLLTGAVSAAFVTAMNSSGSTTGLVQTSNDAQIIAAFLVRDAQGAGGVDPTSPAPAGDSSLGVSVSDAAGCGPGTGLLFRFKWRDWVTSTVSRLLVANYFYDPATDEVIRVTCTNGGPPTSSILGYHITSATPSCNPAAACPGIPDSVSLTISEPNNGASASSTVYTYTLRATVRPQGQAVPTGTTVSFPTLLALGGSCPTPGVTAAGNNTTVTVNGQTVINGADTGSCQLLSTQGGATFTSTPSAVFPPTGLLDPYLTMPSPNGPTGQPFDEAASCLNQSNPGTTTDGSGVVHYQPGVYQVSFGITKDSVFAPGVYFFCHGVPISGNAKVNAADVLFYFAQGALSISSANSVVTMSGLSSGPDQGFVIWMPRTNSTSTLNLSGNTTVNQFNGLIYVPNVDVTLSGSAGVQIGSIIARTITFTGGGNTHVGPYTPSIGAPNPTSGPPGTSVSISGSGFVANSPITVNVGSTAANITAGGTSNATGNVAVTFTVPAMSPGNYAVSVADGGGNTATSGTQFNVTAPTRLVFTSTPVSGTASATATLGPVTVQMQDATNNPVNAPAGGTVVTLTSTSTGTTRFSTTSGGAAVTSVTIPAGSSSASFFYGDTKAGTPTVTAASTGFTPGTQTETITPGAIAGIILTNITTAPNPALTQTGVIGTTLAYTSTPQPNNSGNVLTARIALADAFGNLVNAAAVQTLDFALTGSTGSTVSPAAGQNVLTINIGTSTTTASFTLTRVTGNNRNVTLTATLHGTTQKFTVTMSS